MDERSIIRFMEQSNYKQLSEDFIEFLFRFNRNFFLDFALVYETRTDDLYPFPNLYTANRGQLVIDATPFELKNSNVKGLITLGYKF